MGAEDCAPTAALGVLYHQTEQGGDDGKLAEMHCETRRRGHSYKLGKRGERLLERAEGTVIAFIGGEKDAVLVEERPEQILSG
jgi:hypothetical protein